MSTEANKSLRSNAPYDGRPGTLAAITANDYGVKKYAGGLAGTETTHHADAVPDHWRGREVGLTASGGVCHYAFSTNPSAEVSATVAVTNAGASQLVGIPIPDSLSVMVRARVPEDGNNTMYFVRESTAVNTVVYMQILA